MSYEQAILAALDDKWRSLRSLRLPSSNTQWLVAPARRLVKRGLIESSFNRSSGNLVYRLAAQADTHPKGGDALAAPFMSGTVGSEADDAPKG